MIVSIWIDKVNEAIGKLFSWLTALLVLLICLDVVMRYVFTTSYAAVTELEWHLFAAIFLLSASYALQYDKHVRVDVFYSKFSEKSKAWVNLIGTLLFLFPLCIVIVMSSIPFVMNSYEILETSPDPGGLPARYIVKSLIPTGFILLFLQGISITLQSIKKLLK